MKPLGDFSHETLGDFSHGVHMQISSFYRRVMCRLYIYIYIYIDM
jgi:hypothetical protein